MILFFKYSIQILFFILNLSYSQTNTELKRAKNFIEANNLSNTQVKKIAKSKGFNDKQIDNFIKDEKKISKSNIFKSDDYGKGKINKLYEERKSVSKMDIEKEGPYLSSEKEIVIIEKSDDLSLDIESKKEEETLVLDYFGYDIFKQDPALFQASAVGIISPDYLIGPGDEIIVMLWGETQFRLALNVDREGYIFIPEIGQVFVNGLNLNLLESKLFRVFSQSYASLSPQDTSPTTFLDLSLGEMRPLRIRVLGEVAQPGAYTISPSASLFSSLYYFKGPTTLGSLRDIQLIRRGEKISSIDFYNYLLTGKKPQDIKLQLDDLIFIPKRLKTVSIIGEINRAGIFELKPDESFSDLIEMAGGLKITAFLERAQIDRIVPFNERKKLGRDRIYNDINLGELLDARQKIELSDGDKIQIFSILDFRQNIVSIRGAISRPGDYDLGDSLKIKDLINKAGGVLGDAYMSGMDVIRIQSDLEEELIKINLKKALEGDIDYNIKLQELDKVKIYSTTEMVEKKYVYIEGHIKFPGKYNLKDNMKAHDLIFMAGGFVDEEFKKKTYLKRADLLRFNDDRITMSLSNFNLQVLIDKPDSETNFFLMPGDKIQIYEKGIFISNKPVSINGKVHSPGEYFIKDNMGLKDLILEAGGFDEISRIFKVEIARIKRTDNLSEYAETIILDLNSDIEIINSGKLNSNKKFLLEPFDIVSVRSDPFSIGQQIVTINGKVKFPGKYVILSSNEKISDILRRAGGVLPNAYLDASKFFRNGNEVNIHIDKIINDNNSIYNFKVENKDKIQIFSSPQLVTILGEVNRPGMHKYVPGKRLRYYLGISGGLNNNGDKNNIWIEYPNGDSRRYKKMILFSPKITDGSAIKVGKAREEEPFDRTEFAKEVATILANIAQTITLIFLATSN